MLVVCYYYGLFILRMHSNCDLIRSKVKIKMYLLLRASISSQPKYCLFFHDINLLSVELHFSKIKMCLKCTMLSYYYIKILNIFTLFSAENYVNKKVIRSHSLNINIMR